jgi:hypothetical protein
MEFDGKMSETRNTHGVTDGHVVRTARKHEASTGIAERWQRIGPPFPVSDSECGGPGMTMYQCDHSP